MTNQRVFRHRRLAFKPNGMPNGLPNGMLFVLALILGLITTHCLARYSQAASNKRQSLTFEDRVAAQRAIEEVYWRRRIWPQNNPKPKPALNEVMTEQAIRAMVEDYLRKSTALGSYWQRSIGGEELQAEMERMARQTNQPDALRELWAALRNDPILIAECLARPLLVERLSRELYASDERFHGELKRRAESELNEMGAAGQMRRSKGEYRETDWVRDETDDALDALGLEIDGDLRMSDAQWQERLSKLGRMFGAREEDKEPPIGQWSGLQENEERFYAMAVTEKGGERIKVASVVWKKTPFDEWWNGARVEMGWDISAPSFEYQLPEIKTVLSPSDGDSWIATSNTGAPSARRSHTAVWTGSEMIVWGGADGGSNFNTGGKYNPATNTWTATSVTGAPEARFGSAGVWTGAEMIVWGGMAGSSVATGGRYNPVTNSWKQTTSSGTPSARSFPTAVWTGSEMIVWGGLSTFPNGLNTGGKYNPVTDTWTPTSTSSAPGARFLHTAVWTGGEMIIWGGYVPPSPFNTGGRYNPTTDTWTATNTMGAPETRFIHTAIWTGSEMIVWGGVNGGELNTGGRYNPTADTWMTTSATGNPGSRSNHSAVWTGSEMIVWGGGTSNVDFNTGGRYNPASNAWSVTATTSAPSPRSFQTAIWTGSAMIVWGGAAGNNARLNTGGRYTITATAGSVASVSAASFLGAEMAAESIVAAFGQNLATATQIASSIPLPTALAGTTVEVTDSAGMTRLAPLFFVSSGQVNYLIPSGVTAGSANVTIRSGAGAVSGGNIRIMAVAPGLFSANSNGQGVAAAVALRARGAMQTFEPIARFDGTKFVSAPIDLGPAGDQIFLLLFGTGIRSRNALSSVTCKIGAVDAPVLFAGAAPGFVGLDQVNIGPLPSVLAGRGELDVALTVDGRTANTVTVAFSGTPTCAYSISPSERSLSAGGGPGSVNVTAPSGCAWTATSNAAWLTISSGAAGNSSGVVNYSVAANTGASQRTGTLTIAGQTFTVTQAAGVQAISVGQLVTGALTNDDLTQMGSGGRSYFYDAHRFSVTSANTTVAIDLRSTQFDAEIILYREENNRLVQVALDDQSGGYGNGVIENNNALLLTTLPTLGDYVIFATSSDVAPNSLGNYTLRLNANALQNLSYGANIANASISTTDIQTSAGVYLDAYWFTGQQGDEVQIRMGSSAFDSFLILQASAGGAPIAFDDNNGGGRDALIRHRLPANGNYIILAMPYAKNLIGAYTLTLSKTN